MDDIARVKEASDIVEVVGEVVALRPKGREMVGLCPFHDDRNPSMYVVPAKQMYTCFVCGAGGDVLHFVQEYHKLEFPEALAYLAKRANIELTPRSRQQGAIRDTKGPLLDASEMAQKLFRSTLGGPGGALARSVIERRAFPHEIVERFGIGAAPDGWDTLTNLLRERGRDPGPFASAGLLKTRPDGTHYDTFRNRLIFPIRDQIGRVIAFGGRKLREEDEPKYLNSPESAIFDKSGVLYGLDLASPSIRKSGRAIVTEGYTDTIACHQHGFENTVATLGTALTPKHAKILGRICREVVLLFDADEAGQRAADRAIEVFFTEPMDVRICALSATSDAKDPDEVFKREGGRDLFTRALDASPDLLTHRLERVAGKLDGLGPGATEAAVREEISRLRELGVREIPAMRRELIVGELARITGISRRLIDREINAPTPSRRRAPAPGPIEHEVEHEDEGEDTQTPPEPYPVARAVSDIPPAQRQRGWLIGWLLAEPSLASVLPGALGAIEPEPAGAGAMPELDEIARTIALEVSAGGPWSAGDILARFPRSPGITSLTHALAQRASGDIGEHPDEASRLAHARLLAEEALRRLAEKRGSGPGAGDLASRLASMRDRRTPRATLPRPRDES